MKKRMLLLICLLMISATAFAQSLDSYHSGNTSTLWADTETADTWYFLSDGLLLVSSYEDGRERIQPYAYRLNGDTLEIYRGDQLKRTVGFTLTTDAEVAAVFEQPPDAPVLTCEAQQLRLLGYVGTHTPLEGLWRTSDGKVLFFFQDFAHTLKQEADGSYLYMGGATVNVGTAVEVLETWDGSVLSHGMLGYVVDGDKLTLGGATYMR